MASAETLLAHLHNVSALGDLVSPACDVGLVERSARTGGFLDVLHGNCWSWTPAVGAAVYGKTEDLPVAPIDALGNGSFLRVPYRRVPIIDVHSADELAAFAKQVKSGDSYIRGVWRGQVRHYTTRAAGRTDDELLRLYGSVDVNEPSLFPSAARSKQYFPDTFGTWSALLDLYVQEKIEKSANSRELLNFVNSYRYRMWGFATAQHYGLPSVGLDVTHDVRVALFFALHTFETDRSSGATTVTRADASASPIIYGLGGFTGHELVDDSELAPAEVLCSRPAAQGAMFFSTGWGKAPNYAAQRIYVALRLVDHATWKVDFDASDLFPRSAEDEFLAFLLERKGAINAPAVQDLLKRIYYVP